MKGAPGLIGLVLDQETSQKLREICFFPNEHCKHVTMAYRPTPDIYAKYQPLIGQDIDFEIVECFFDTKGQAVTVSGVPSEKEFPHITISTDDGVMPSYSNELIARLTAQDPRPEERRVGLGLRGRGTVMWVPF